MPEFIPGLALNEAFFHEAVRPILDDQFSNLAYSAGLIGFGSDVLGFDTQVSSDHFWGPRLLLFLRKEDYTQKAAQIQQVLRFHLPYQFRGYSTHFGEPDPADGGTRVTEAKEGGPVEHFIQCYTIENFWQQELGIRPDQSPRPVVWLTFQEHRLLTLTAGKIFRDDLGLEAVRQKFAYYPREVWLYLLAAEWGLLSQEEAFVGRTSQVGDELGSRVVAARLVERLMHLCFLMEKKYAPYSKWFGTAFRRLDCYPQMGPFLNGILAAGSYPEREKWLVQAYCLAADLHNRLGITPDIEARTRTYSGWHCLRDGIENLASDDPRNTRPHQVIFGGRFSDAILEQIRDPEVLAFLKTPGSVNQFLVESSDALQNVQFCRGLAPLLHPQPSE